MQVKKRILCLQRKNLHVHSTSHIWRNMPAACSEIAGAAAGYRIYNPLLVYVLLKI